MNSYKILEEINFFGVRHASPISSHMLLQYLNNIKPKLVLIEGSSSANCLIDDITDTSNKLPIAILEYDKNDHKKFTVSPFAEFSPEYQALVWTKKHNCVSAFIDLNANMNFNFSPYFKSLDAKNSNELNDDDENSITDANKKKLRYYKQEHKIYNHIAKAYGENDYDDFWESNFEHLTSLDEYMNTLNVLLENIRKYLESKKKDFDFLEYEFNLMREKYMQHNILSYIKEYNIEPSAVVVVCGAYHVLGLKNKINFDIDEIKKYEDTHSISTTLMPYSFKRLSSFSGYSAGIVAPFYYQKLWEDKKNNSDLAGINFVQSFVKLRREKNHEISTANIIDIIELANSLRIIRNRQHFILKDIKDAIISTIGDGSFHFIGKDFLKCQIGNSIGHISHEKIDSPIRQEFYLQIEKLNLDKYLENKKINLVLSFRKDFNKQNNEVLSIDKSTFLHRLRVLNINFAKLSTKYSSKNLFEQWSIGWSEALEIELVISLKYGTNILTGVKKVIYDKIQSAKTLPEVSQAIDDLYKCGISDNISDYIKIIENFLMSTNDFKEIMIALTSFLNIYEYKNIRHINIEKVEKLISILYSDALKLLTSILEVDLNNINSYAEYVVKLYNITTKYPNLFNGLEFYKYVMETYKKSKNTPIINGLLLNILVISKKLDKDVLKKELKYRISPLQDPKDISIWLYGLLLTNKAKIIEEDLFWNLLTDYITQIDDSTFKMLLISFRRSLATFNNNEKTAIYMKLSKVLNLDSLNIAQNIDKKLNKEELSNYIDDFDFGDLL